MANNRAQGMQIRDFNPQGPALTPLAAVERPRGEGDGALATVSKTLSDKVGAFSDELAVMEGKRAGAIDGTDPNFQTQGYGTLRSRARDKEGTEVYFSNLTSRFQTDANGLYEKHRDDLPGFKTAYEDLTKKYLSSDVLPEVKGYFTSKAMDVGNVMSRSLLSRFENNQADKAKATLVTGIAESDTHRSRVLAMDPYAPEAEREVLRIREENIGRIRATVASGGMSEVQGAQAILAERGKASSDLIVARANTLKTPEELDAYRKKVRADFTGGKIDGLQDFETLDGHLAKRGQAMRVEGERAIKELDGSVSDFLDRAGKGDTPSSVEWMALEEKGNALGGRGRMAVTLAREKLRLRARIDAASPEQADALIRDLEANAKGGASARLIATPQERDLMIRTILGEAGGESDAGQAAVAHVIKTRAMSGNYGGSTIEGVIRAPKQFSVWNEGDPAGAMARGVSPDDPRYQKIGRLVDDVLAGKVADPTGGAGHYYNPAAASPDWGPALAQRNDVRIGNHRFVGRIGNGVSPQSSELLDDARTYAASRRTLIGTDPLRAAEKQGVIPRLADVDLNAAPDQLAGQMRARVAQAEAVATHFNREVTYLRPDDREAAKAIMQQGGDKALNLIDGIIAGAGGRSLRVLDEIGGDAPALAHAALTVLSTGDRSFAKQVAEAQKARAVPGAKVASPAADDVNDVLRETVGTALNGIDAAERERTRAAAVLWSEQELARRNIDPKDGAAKDVLKEGFQRARGRTGSGDKAFGGVVSLPYGGGWMRAAAPVQIPADVRADKFGDVLNAITDDDLKAMPNAPMATGGAIAHPEPPVAASGNVLTAAQLRRALPIFGPGGYQFGVPDAITGRITPIIGADGKAFTLDWNAIAPALRSRVPAAFR